MSNDKRRFWSPLNLALTTMFFVVSTVVYVGFFRPDMSILGILPYAYTIWLTILLFFPAIVLGLFFLYRAVRLGKVKPGSAIITVSLILNTLLLAFVGAELVQNRKNSEKTAQFHTFLQLRPYDIADVDSTRYNIFCLGGSTTEFTNPRGEGWPSLAQKGLNSRYGYKNVSLVNCGRQWYSSLHILIHYTQNVRKFKPNAIIVMENINDLLQNADTSRMSTGSFRSDYGHFLGPITLLVKLNGFAGELEESIRSLWFKSKPAEIEKTDFPGLASFERNLKTIITLARHDGTKVILMTQPNIYKEKMSPEELGSLTMLNVETVGNGKKWSFSTAYKGLNAYNDMIRKVAAEEQVELIDLEKRIPKSRDYFYDDVHYQDKAYDLISRVVADELSKRLPDNAR